MTDKRKAARATGAALSKCNSANCDFITVQSWGVMK
jgi:hypothetical protein